MIITSKDTKIKILPNNRCRFVLMDTYHGDVPKNTNYFGISSLYICKQSASHISILVNTHLEMTTSLVHD